MSCPLQIALISDELGWHSTQLIASFKRRSCELTQVLLRECYFDDSTNGLCLPGFGDRLPDGVFVRGIPAGSLETVTFYLGVLHALERLGVFVYNQASMIERSVDKTMTSFLLARHSISTPAAWSFADWQRAERLVKQQVLEKRRRLVLKPVFGSQGKGLHLIADRTSWLQVSQYLQDEERICYLQTFVESEEANDWRVFVVGGTAIAAMKRVGRDWINNVACGAVCVAAELQNDICELAQEAVSQLGLFYGGVDMIKDSDGRWWVVEVNSIPAWKGLQGVSTVNIADYLVDDFLASYRAHAK